MELSKNTSVFLNLLRALAAQAVVVGHIISWAYPMFKKIQPPYLPHMQAAGVVVFFILSGFIIPYSTITKYNIQKSNFTFKEYFIDRFSRVYSALIPCLVLIIILDGICLFNGNYDFNSAFNLKTFFGNILMLEDYPVDLSVIGLKLTSFGSARPLWTLAIEWWIYLWFGYLFVQIYKKKKVNISSLIILIFLCIVPYINFAPSLPSNIRFFNIGLSLDLNSALRGGGLMITWLFGTIILLLYSNVNSFFKTKKFFLSMVILFFAYQSFIRYRAVHFNYADIYFTIYLSIIILCLLLIFQNISFGNRINDLIEVMANYSFTLYLIHYTIINIFIVFCRDMFNPHVFNFLALILSNFLSYIFAKYTEMKYKLVRDYLKLKFLKLSPY